MRIGFVSTFDPREPAAISGMPFHMRRELTRLGEVVDLVPTPHPPRAWVRSAGRNLLPALVREGLQGLFERHRTATPSVPSPDPAAALEEAARLSRLVSQQVARQRLDVLFGCCVSTLLYQLRTELPVVYAGDTTARLIHAGYWNYRQRPEGYKQACDVIEGAGLRRANQLALASEVARRSAIEDYGADPARVHVVPLGSNVVPPWPLRAPAPIRPPSRARLQLLLVGHEPRRKRLDLAIEAVGALRAWGWDARLDVIGRPTPLARRTPWVRCAGPLNLASAIDRVAHRWRITRAHALLLPSEAEAFGIAPGEAAHHGRPSVVSAAGGLPEVVVHGETGLVVPMDGGPREYASAILELVSDPARWQRACVAALRRAHDVLSWDRWRERIAPLLDAAVAEPRVRLGA